MTKVWQIAAGTSDRNYTDLFLNHDIIFMGPGYYGDFNEYEENYKQCVTKGIATSNKISQIRSFVRDINPGDIVLLRNVHKVISIGIVDKAGYNWNSTFDDIFGWDLQHTQRVIWQDQLSSTLKDIQKTKKDEVFSHMKQIPTLSRVHGQSVLAPIVPLFSKCIDRPLKTLPQSAPMPLSIDEIGQELFSKGLPNEAVDKVLLAIQRQRRLINWYERDGVKSNRPTEHEVVAHMILPLMLALGWSEQLLAVEWHKIDLAAFDRTPTTKESCVLVCEAKGWGHGLQNVLEQAKTYIQNWKLNHCKKILLTDGGRLYVYEKTNIGSVVQPTGYLNVNAVRTNHIAPINTNAIDTIASLTPAGIMRKND